MTLQSPWVLRPEMAEKEELEEESEAPVENVVLEDTLLILNLNLNLDNNQELLQVALVPHKEDQPSILLILLPPQTEEDSSVIVTDNQLLSFLTLLTRWQGYCSHQVAEDTEHGIHKDTIHCISMETHLTQILVAGE
jgi:hypothetical protein